MAKRTPDVVINVFEGNDFGLWKEEIELLLMSQNLMSIVLEEDSLYLQCRKRMP